MRQKIMDKAREYIDTPFVHQARLKGIGVDCVGLISGVGQELNLLEIDYTVYPRYSDGTLLMKIMKEIFTEVPIDKRDHGDIIIYWVDAATKHPQHIGIMTDIGIIHTYDKVMKVVETHSHPRWDARITNVFQWPGVGN